jgi:FtsH-binding integral membrane protein
MDFETILLGLALLVSLVVAAAAFVSKTMVWHPPFHSNPQKITWFGRMFMFLAGSVGVLQFGLAILKRQQVTINPAWPDVGLPVTKFFLEILFLVLALPFLISSIRGLIRREEPNKINRLITVALAIVWAYLLWNVLPGMAKEISGVFHR